MKSFKARILGFKPFLDLIMENNWGLTRNIYKTKDNSKAYVLTTYADRPQACQ
jgi:hypothetical protein